MHQFRSANVVFQGSQLFYPKICAPSNRLSLIQDVHSPSKGALYWSSYSQLAECQVSHQRRQFLSLEVSCRRQSVCLSAVPEARDSTSVSRFGLTVFEKLIAVIMFALPFCEGLIRLLTLLARALRHAAVDLLCWTARQTEMATLALASRKSSAFTREDLEALDGMSQALRALYSRWTEVLDGLLSFSPVAPSAAGSPPAPLSSQALSAPCTLWDGAWLLSMALVAQMASMASQASGEKSSGKLGHLWFRLPQVVLACHCCALLLRISLPPLGSSSGVSSGVYGGVAAMLTLATTCLAAAQAQQVLRGDWKSPRESLVALVAQAGNIAWANCSLLCLDWCLALFSPQTAWAKAASGLALLCTLGFLIETQHLGAGAARAAPR